MGGLTESDLFRITYELKTGEKVHSTVYSFQTVCDARRFLDEITDERYLQTRDKGLKLMAADCIKFIYVKRVE